MPLIKYSCRRDFNTKDKLFHFFKVHIKYQLESTFIFIFLFANRIVQI